jgi:type I restriction enzyme R subunit
MSAGLSAYGLGFSEDALVEQPAIQLFRTLGWEVGDPFDTIWGPRGSLARESDHEVVLLARLRRALERLNPGLPADALDAAIEELTRDRSALSDVAANQDLYELIKNGVKVKARDERGRQQDVTVRVIDWRAPEHNDFFLASQVWVHGEMYRRRCDLVGFVNGLPLVLVELKASHTRLQDAYDKNLRDYRDTIPALFRYSGVVILSNGRESRIGSTTATYEHFAEWKRVEDEDEIPTISLSTMLRGTCRPDRLLDIVENFTAFEEGKGGLIKKVGKNHQVLGVNRSIEAVQRIRENRGRLGVFWHTQGSGKSLSMLFFAQKVLRTLPGNWTFVIVTDREELDDQIYKTFAACGAVTEKHAQASSGAHLKQLLTEDHRYVFTLIQKFGTAKGESYPELSQRSDIIVMTDEAHRSQYDTLALNMRNALPKAAFIGFTGTPLMAGEEKTREVFGDYVSIYNFTQSIEDGATVPLYYENRIPELQLTNENLNEDMERLLENAELDEAQEQKLEREFGREYHLITREERLEKVASDIVLHFLGRGYRGKAMVICIDKATAVRMYDKMQQHWVAHRAGLEASLAGAGEAEREETQRTLAEMAETDMAVVVSQSQNEIADLRAKGLDIRPHRRRMQKEDLETRFKDEDDRLRIVFLCAMWITGFDVPACSTIYLDKPMRNHTLMQTIARANRVARDKNNGLIVDYAGVFRSLQRALAIYGKPSPGAPGEVDMPILDKDALVEHLQAAIGEALALCKAHDVDPRAILAAEGLDRVALIGEAVERIVTNDEEKRRFIAQASRVAKIFQAIKPDPRAGAFAPVCVVLAYIAKEIRSLMPPADISEVMRAIEQLLDESIATEGYVIHAQAAPDEDARIDLSRIDFDALRARFEGGRKRTEAERLRSLIEAKLKPMVERNRTRMDFLEKFQKMIEAYNAGSQNVEQFFEELLRFAQSLSEEEQRGIAEGLTEEELALFDLLTKPEPKLTKKEAADVKKVVRELLEVLKAEKLMLDWRKHQRSKAVVRAFIEQELDKLPPAYGDDLWQQKCELAFQHIFDAYPGEGRSLYAAA